MSKKQFIINKLLPLILCLFVIGADQITKAIVVKNIPLHGDFTAPLEEREIPVAGDYIQLIHVRNNAIAFSLGSGFSDTARIILFKVMVLIVIAAVFVIYFRNNEFTKLQRWSICGILGGGLGNLIDRFFRPAGVVDFIDCWFPKKLIASGRWPTFNVADMAVVICGCLFILTFVLQVIEDMKKKKTSKDKADE